MADSIDGATQVSTEIAEAAPAVPLLRVVKGEPTAEELAALVAVVAARSGGDGDDTAPAPRSSWTDRSRYVRRPLVPGPRAWRDSALPR
jgi:hypothetical protein